MLIILLILYIYAVKDFSFIKSMIDDAIINLY